MTKQKTINTNFYYPRGNFPRLCLAGNSNVGKSSITKQILTHPSRYKGKIGKTAGSTIRLTIINDPNLKYHVIDLPGFGYMKRLSNTQESYIKDQIVKYVELDVDNLFLAIVVANSVRIEDELQKFFFDKIETIPLTIELITFFVGKKIPVLFVLNKIDKINKFALTKIKKKVISVLKEFGISEQGINAKDGLLEIHYTSALKDIGIKELKKSIKNREGRLDLSKYDPRKELFNKLPINHRAMKREKEEEEEID